MYDQVTMKLSVEPLILSALKEDITSEDVSTNSVMPNPKQGEVDLMGLSAGYRCLSGYSLYWTIRFGWNFLYRMETR